MVASRCDTAAAEPVRGCASRTGSGSRARGIGAEGMLTCRGGEPAVRADVRDVMIGHGDDRSDDRGPET